MAPSIEKYRQITRNIGVLCDYTNVGVITTPQGIYLMDPGGTVDTGKEIIDALSKLFPGKEVEGIFLTHAHTDHTGGIPPILETFSSTVYAGKTTACFLEVPQAIGYIYSGSKPGKEMGAKEFVMDDSVKTDIILADGQEIDLGSAIVKTIDLPGHCPGMTGFIVEDKDEGKKSFFLGDAFFGMKMLSKIWIPFILSPKEFRKSIEKIERTASDFYVPAHGEISTVETAGCVAEHNIMITYELEDLILKLIEKGNMGNDGLVEAIANYAGMKMKSVNYFLILCTVKSYLSSLEEDGKIENYMENNRLIWRLKK